MISVGMMQPSIHEIIDMTAVRNCFMPTRRTMGMRAVRFRRAPFRIGGADRDDVLVNIVLVYMVEMAIVQVVDVPLVA
jgi:hypothetical protein